MNYRQALKETMFRFDLKVTDLSEKAGIKSAQLSAFRTGKRDLYVTTLEQIVNSMPPQAQAYFYELLWRCTVNPGTYAWQGLQAPPFSSPNKAR